MEIEFSGISLEQAAHIITNLYGGHADQINDALFEVKNTVFGTFNVEIDAVFFKILSETINKEAPKAKQNIAYSLRADIAHASMDLGAKIVPFEIATPPIKLHDLVKLEALRTALLHAGAKDTKESFYFAFGLHINPEVASLNTDYIIKHIQSFLLLSTWLEQAHNIDLTRKITTFIDPFPKSYLQSVLNENYKPTTDQLMHDYHKHNPTRNRALDMLPLFAYINEPLVRRLYGNHEKIKKRPTFHYRLPNCELANPNWSFSTEWNRWLAVEKLANNEHLLYKLIKLWWQHKEHWFAFESDWLKEIDNCMQSIQ